MRSALLAAVLLAGCAAPPEPEPAPTPGPCACARKVCACEHCRGDAASAPKCPCKNLEKPE